MLDVSNWHKLCGLGTATFTLTDNEGNKTARLAKEGDYIKIDIPGPGSKTGNGYDWVRIETIEDKRDEPNNYEAFTMRARPAKNPAGNADETAHFFQDEATSTFMVVRDANTVKAEIHGRNELPNIEQETRPDTIRNAVIALVAMLGLSKSQWKKLVEGLVSSEMDEYKK